MLSDSDEDDEPIEAMSKSVDERIKDFSDLLKNIETLNDKKRQLWKEIYVNAISDRQNSYMMFAKLVKLVGSKTTEFAVHGKTLTGFIERMSRANDQLIKLADLIAAAESKDEEIDPDEMFERIRD